ncbi:TetR family transcriptional regulator [Amycolatopsis mediterranei S699]|uniref:TetR family transcriptional regulator n=2 Tax=Amycolatopsis mediterranei TaxID=33910 RepID=A0A9R0P421_AMYMS|nr:TetR family transcriptional regulator [Amycolatopsis mediterranei S699]
MFAERGVHAVSNRQICEAAGQGNNAAVGYHFGTKAELVRAIASRHSAAIDELRRRRLAGIGGDATLRDWISCLVTPVVEHLAAAGSSTWYGRFGAQMMTDPALRPIMVEESLSSPALVRIVAGVHRCSPPMPAGVRAERGDMTRQLLVHVVADHERALAEGSPPPRRDWPDVAAGLIDALTGLWSAPVTAPEPADQAGFRPERPGTAPARPAG